MLEFDLSKITDPRTAEAIQRVREQLRDQPLLRGQWKFFEITFTAAVTNFKYPHNLGFTPTDIIQTRVTGGTVTWNYTLFDVNNLDITTSAACSVRAFIGRYETDGRV